MEEYEKNIARVEREHAMVDICSLKIEIARLDERLKAAADALKLAEGKVSRATIFSVVTALIAILALAVNWMRR